MVQIQPLIRCLPRLCLEEEEDPAPPVEFMRRIYLHPNHFCPLFQKIRIHPLPQILHLRKDLLDVVVTVEPYYEAPILALRTQQTLRTRKYCVDGQGYSLRSLSPHKSSNLRWVQDVLNHSLEGPPGRFLNYRYGKTPAKWPPQALSSWGRCDSISPVSDHSYIIGINGIRET